MIFVLILLLILLFAKSKVYGVDKFNKSYMSREQTTYVKGVFVILVMLSHCSGYVHFEGVYDLPYVQLQGYLGQMIVVMFFFYSGYGMMKSILEKRFSYVKTIPVKRFFRTYFNYFLALILFFIMGLFVGTKFTASGILFTLLGWENIGNSNWFMFNIFCAYLLMFVSFLLLKLKETKAMVIVCNVIFTVAIIVFVFLLMKSGKEPYWYNTIFIMPFGCWFAIFEKQINKLFMTKDILYYFLLALMLPALLITFVYRYKNGIECYTLYAVLFTLTVVVITMKLELKSEVLKWFGNHVFSIYILQRIPMIILANLGYAEHEYVFLALSVAFSILISIAFDYVTAKLGKRIFG